MTITLPSGREEFKAFQTYYSSDIAPYLQGQEAGRRLAVQRGSAVLVVALVIALLVGVFSSFGEAKFHIAFAIGAIGLGIAGWLVGNVRTKITEGLLGRVCLHFGYGYQQKINRPMIAGEVDRLKLFGYYNREIWEDEVKGVRHGVDFSLCEAHLKYKSSGKNSSTTTVFHGQLLVLDYHKEFLGETVLRRDAGLLNRFTKPGKEFQHVGIVSPKFEKIFEAWSTDQMEARELLDPIVLERFEELDRLFSGSNLQAAFSKGRLLLVIETGDRLNMGSMFKPLEGTERVEEILNAFDAIFDLIDVLVKRLEGRIDGALTADALRDT